MEERLISSMPATLIDGGVPGFSETARSRPHAREATRDRPRIRPLAVRAGRYAHDLAERTAEGPEAGEPHVEADLGHAAIGLAQHEHGALDPAALEVAMRRLAERRPEGPDEMRLRHVRDARERGDVERLGEAAVHGVAGTQHPPVRVLDGTAHRAIFLESLE